MIKIKSKKISLYAIFVCLMILFSWIYIPLPMGIPFTFQVFGVLLISFILKKNSWKILGIYLILGILGLPVFSGFNSGIGTLLGPTGGFLIGFFISSFIYFFNFNNLISGIFQIIIIYITGIYFFKVYKDIDIFLAIKILVPTFIWLDIFKLILALIVYKIFLKYMNKGIDL
ncbi:MULTISPECIES: biotin transporter BioY [Oceanotoga]|nr:MULTISPECIES: biotin transporter BioY [Oceanotoga]